jgi:predicted RNase H-like nuclease (RuvC/YqgF family)
LGQNNELLENKVKEQDREIDSLKDRVHNLQVDLADNNGSSTELIEKNSQIAELNNKVLDVKEIKDDLKKAEDKV